MKHRRITPLVPRGAERGAAVFVVVLIITLLSALGLFAVRSTSTLVASSGYNRQLNQTHYLTDLGVIATMAYAGHNPHAIKKLMMQGLQPGDAQCVAYNKQTTPTCMLVGYDDIDSRVQMETGTQELVDEVGRPPHPSVRPLDADFRVEITDLHPSRPVRGHEVAGGSGAASRLRFAHVTVTANGIVRPQQKVAGTWDTKSASAAGVEMSRAHLIIGPVTF